MNTRYHVEIKGLKKIELKLAFVLMCNVNSDLVSFNGNTEYRVKIEKKKKKNCRLAFVSMI